MSWGKKWDRKNKYGGSQRKKIEHAGHWFDSKLEQALFDLLSLRERAGEISNLSHQPGTVFLSEARIQYRPDFRFTNCKTGETEYAESKGFPNDKWPLKKKLWRFYGPGKLEIWMGTARSLRLVETIIPKKGTRMGFKEGQKIEAGDWVRVRKTMHTMRENIHAKYEMTREGRVLEIRGKFKQLAKVRVNLKQLPSGIWLTEDMVFSHKVITVLEKAKVSA